PVLDKKGRPKPDKARGDTEQVPFKYPGGVKAFFEAEVKPYAPDAWIDKAKTRIGYEISFTKHFYKPVELRPLEAIRADLLALQREGEGLLDAIVGDSREDAKARRRPQ
ncbi:MAG: hypothetical protein GX635_09550, partial [Synergistaceae bacterium]|nr:hypothetical protein [Synergistaceae bacterium]